MPLPEGDALRRQLAAAGGARGDKPIPPMLPGEWKPGMPCHWTEQTRFFYWKCRITRFFVLLNLACGTAYLIYRGKYTIGIFVKHPALIAYQIFFLLLEVISVFSIVFRVFELWEITNRNSVDFKRLPNELISTNFAYGRQENVRPQYSNYPSVAVFIPCYNESADLVLETVLGAVAIDYPAELLTVYLCDDGKDDMKRNMIAQLRNQHQNLYYVTRPDNAHAKAGNLNYSLERTRSDLVVTLDADFVARPNLLQRLMSYYYVWNPQTELYEFNDLLAVVQTPQHFRNLSPYDADPLDQRATFFCEAIMPGKDWWNASTMIGTTNLLNRVPLAEAGYYPYHSITEDSAMSLAFHALGYRTFYVNESLASGLATTSMHSNIGQRSRWLKGDYQILFNWTKSPATVRGLAPIQRFLYLNMSYSRLVSIVHFFYDILVVLLLLAKVSPLDAPNIVMFICFFGAYILSGVVLRFVIVFGGQGLDKSESGSMAFESMFRYPTLKGLFAALFMGQNLKFKVTDKSKVRASTRAQEMRASNRMPDRDDPAAGGAGGAEGDLAGGATTDEYGSGMTQLTGVTGTTVDESNLHRIALPIAPEGEEAGGGPGHEDLGGRRSDTGRTSRTATSHTNFSDGNSSDVDEDGEGYNGKAKRYFKQSKEERAERRHDIRKNLKRLWFNIVCATVLIFAIVWAFYDPPVNTITGGPRRPVTKEQEDSALLQISMAIGFAIVNLLPHLMGIYLCFIPYVSGWLMTDLVHGRCDQYAVHPRTGKLFVPWSFISLLSVAKAIIMLGALAALAVFIYVKRDLVV